MHFCISMCIPCELDRSKGDFRLEMLLEVFQDSDDAL